MIFDRVAPLWLSYKLDSVAATGVESSLAWRLWGRIVRLTWLTSDEEPERFVVVVVAVVVASSLGRSSGVRYGRIADGNNKTAIEIRPISRHSADGLQFVLRETHSLT